MALFRTTPNLPDDEKARIEFHLQQIAECIGFDRCQLPILNEEALIYDDRQSALRTSDQIKQAVGQHLGHDVVDINLETTLLAPEKCGGGG